MTPSPIPARDDAAIFADPAQALDARLAAFRRLLTSTDPAAIESVTGTLSTRDLASELQAGVVREIGASASVPAAFLPILEAWLKQATPDRQPAFYRAISSIRTRDAARLLLAYSGPSATAENRDSIFQSLTRLSGRTDIGSDRQGWVRWLEGVSTLSESDWRSQLSENLAGRADQLRVQRDDALRRLVDSQRSRFLAAQDSKARTAILAELLRDDLTLIRRLAIDLINRELANARELGPEVGTGVLELLRDPSADIRSAGADLIDRLIPLGAPLAVREALARERDPNVLAKLLRLARRFPDVAPPELLLGWLGADTAIRRAAIDALAAMQAAGIIASPIDLERAVTILRSERPEEISLDGLKLLCELGNDADRQTVAGMLASPSADARVRAAQALAQFPERLDAIIAATKDDPTMFSIAAAAIARHRATLAGYQALLTLKAPSSSALREAANAICQRLTLKDLREAASDTTDLEVRESMLARVVDLTAVTTANPTYDPFRGDDGKDLADSLLMLADTQIELIKPGAALGTLELLPVTDETLQVRARPCRMKALLYLDRPEEAMELDGSADEWLDALEYAVALPHALAIRMEIEWRFGNDLTETQKARLARLNDEARRPRAASNGPR